MRLQGPGLGWLPLRPVAADLPGAGGRPFGAAARLPVRLGSAGSPAVQV